MINDKTRIVKRLVVDTGISEEHIKLIIDDVFYAMLEAMKTCNSVEMSGFGRWILYENKIKRDIARFTKLAPTLSEEKQTNVLLLANELIKRLGDEENQLVTDFRRMEEQIITTRASEEPNRGNL